MAVRSHMLVLAMGCMIAQGAQAESRLRSSSDDLLSQSSATPDRGKLRRFVVGPVKAGVKEGALTAALGTPALRVLFSGKKLEGGHIVGLAACLGIGGFVKGAAVEVWNAYWNTQEQKQPSASLEKEKLDEVSVVEVLPPNENESPEISEAT